MLKGTRIRFLLVALAIACLLLLSACVDAEQLGRDIGKFLHDFWSGLVQGCSGSAMLPVMAGLVALLSLSRGRHS